ncbi:MAG: transcription termination factor NusA [Bacteroidota bacterium]|nr:transcription termination factor NusA [Bacteroidota bacterium]GIR60102.1 MAG: transcription termination/antitermination protein NusA [Crocinitomicaceae bacterium]MEC7083944.1 transcription termination factor NusA [Bacteroidota bacterium]MEC7127691.1 transcription termination factor NusA [Bacteroidota bacterium]MEC7527387.1 transcription termination factor NusA [Bacteroidota bacterium]|tara:strand:+ start:770 stop:2005 length:1236 start_codon:yes stop_codon:yes gene_type:complete
MNAIDLIDSFTEFKELKNIDRVTMMRIVEDVFRTTLKRKYGSDDNVDVIINPDKGDLEIWLSREIVQDVDLEDEGTQIKLSEALKIEPDFEIGEEVSQEIKVEDFGRRNILALRQNLVAKVLELEKDGIYQKYKERVGDIVNGEVYQIWKREILVLDDDGNELILPKSEQIPSDYFRKGDTIRAVVAKVDLRNNNPVIILSRTAPEFLARLFEQEVPEVFDGLITIKKIVRNPGERAKVAVESYDDRIDPVGACVGMNGTRIHGIVRELRNENIDVIPWTNNMQLLIQRSLNPAKITNMEINDDEMRVEVFLKPDEVSKAIGKGGHNIKLASKLTGYEIDVYREGAEDIDDVDLDEFSDEIDGWIIDELKAIGCDSAKSVLEIGVEDLVKRTDLEEETIEEIVKILNSEFE